MGKSLAAILLAGITLLSAGKLAVIQLSPLVGDTIDCAERESYRLFPGISGFRHALVCVGEDSVHRARISFGAGDQPQELQIDLSSMQLHQLVYLIDRHELVEQQLVADENTALTLSRFWQGLHPGFAGRPTARIGRPPELASPEARFLGVLHGTTLGSAVGGCAGSHLGTTMVSSGSYHNCAWSPPVYRVNPCVFWPLSCLGAGGGAAAGYRLADKLGQSEAKPLPREGRGWRTGLAIGFAVPGAAVGLLAVAALGPTMFGAKDFWGTVKGAGLTELPAVVFGLGLAIECGHLGYRFGRSIDRRNALRAARQRDAELTPPRGP